MLNKIALLLIVILLLVGCGRLSQPTKPEGTTYPYPYGVSQNAK